MRPPSNLRPLVRIANGTFYRYQPITSTTSTQHHNPPLFSNLTFNIPSAAQPPIHWSVVGPSLSGKTTFLQVLRGQHLCFPPTARSFPYLSTKDVPPHLRVSGRALQYVGFDSGSDLGSRATTATHLSARYESKREKTDFSLRNYLLGNTELNALARPDDEVPDEALLARVVHDLRLAPLLDLPVAFLSNGQGRRARIARALLSAPEALLLDEPFMGLDPPTVAGLSPLLHTLANAASLRLVMSARPQDPIPDWITHLVYLRADRQVAAMGEKDVVLEDLRKYVRGVRKGTIPEDDKMTVRNIVQMGKTLTARGVEGTCLMGDSDGNSEAVPPGGSGMANDSQTFGEPLVEMDGCQVQYQGKIAMGNWKQKINGTEKRGLIWTVRRGERWGIFGPNGSGKTTVLSLICSDHPQTYSLPVKLFGKSRIPEPGSGAQALTIWDIQARIGHSSPEIHQLIPRNLTIRGVVENAWADTFRTRAKLETENKAQVDAALRWFADELNPDHLSSNLTTDGDDLTWADHYMFGEISFSAQRLSLFLRAVIKHPDIVVLDEACSGMDDSVRDKCLLFLEYGETREYSEKSDEPVESQVSKEGKVNVQGLGSQQALICISHVREEIPGCVRDWLCLPEANQENKIARFGRASGSPGRDERAWREIWGMTG